MLSLDVTSLFINIPTNLTIDTIERRWNEIKPLTIIMKQEFTRAVKFCLVSCMFKFNGICYKQIFCTAIGSPLSPATVNLVMEKLENYTLLNVSFEIPFYARYI